ncbi:DUF397 domain-containing protein [Fodinicola acaciae]|uniref:DUF397 domain-containing protein n=1 Tax=Fodinicola acaciae TaxID=2681555 RepID=UPI0013D22603|nr:DUF397 domain-containing protein [Fodinicola acaciae]
MDNQIQPVWRTSSYSGGNGGTCVEVAANVPDVTLVRDSTLGEASPVLVFTPAQWATFLDTIKAN